ncbi:rod shape-determining protein MreC [Paucibacter aquatile]|uniref:Cell shape-determining protein MreC n=1 Tax=Kinneretia aquatilis TaxID=2070761 RepID=A0A2N8KYY8_9BURK|nr:rod shape-determining protein MreC [Paucibacter aquatile]PND38676.1 rod shape-determining protein MreC [Paucibacter aquatile]
MPLGPPDRNPPPFFRQGASAQARLLLCAALAVFLMVADARFHVVGPARAGLALLLHPFQRLLLTPVDAWESFEAYRLGTQRAMEAEALARQQLVQQAERLARAAQLQAENQRLRALLELRPALEVASLSAEVLYEAADPYSRRVVIDRGSKHGVQAGSPVINDAGVLGQVTRVYTLSAEVTLLSDKDAAIPVLNTRTQARNAAFGSSDGNGMELRFLAANADIKPGDLMATSGLDGVYPSGLPVAKVSSVERRGDTSFASVRLQPVAQPDSVRHVLVLQPQEQHAKAMAEAAAAQAADAASAAQLKAQRKAAAAQAKAEGKTDGKSEKSDAGAAP